MAKWISFSRKILCGLWLGSMWIGIPACGGNDQPCQTKHCRDFKTQKAAQAAYESDPDCYADLDRDHDGIACEDLPSD